jgi:hypothetical protein
MLSSWIKSPMVTNWAPWIGCIGVATMGGRSRPVRG